MKFVGQKGQDRWVIESVFGGKRDGFFLDLAASDGIKINNTILLERELGWNGIAVEANPTYFASLIKNRACCTSDACVDGDFGEVDFLPNDHLGGIVAEDTDNSWRVRAPLLRASSENQKILRLPTKPLADILREFGAPPVIDYFSFDVEGAETRILRNFPFDRYTFLAMTIERPTPELNEILFARGYRFVKNVTFDTFYIHESLPNADRLAYEPFEQVPPKDR